MLTYTFTTPLAVGVYPNQIVVAGVQLASVSFNFEKAKATAATPVCAVSIILQDPVSGHKVANPQFCDAACLALIQAALAATNPTTGHTFEADILTKALTATDAASGKALLPPGTTAAVAT